MTGDLFAPPPTCGVCVHRNAQPMAAEGDCAPVGRRRADDKPCAWWFGLGQLRAAIGARPR